MSGQGFSLGTTVSSTNKTDCHDIIEILLKVALNSNNHKTTILLQVPVCFNISKSGSLWPYEEYLHLLFHAHRRLWEISLIVEDLARSRLTNKLFYSCPLNVFFCMCVCLSVHCRQKHTILIILYLILTNIISSLFFTSFLFFLNGHIFYILFAWTQLFIVFIY